ncbi:GNAT family N-acetyltransferase [Lentzea tibetensis]|uniref:GNAT family N-acetyltransferase n=1 Tax=Lentzea tibetensis TaxID=2591470 RepID=UPI001C9918A0|nr:GNAT family N-acetyltransferase [Lentzea tibetensis]
MIVRELDRSTAPSAVEAVFEGLSARSRYLRFHAPAPRLTSAMRRALTDVDGHDHAAVAAVSGGRSIGIARLIATGCGRAEIAVSVADAWQRRGVGRRLLTALGDLAARLRYTELYGEVLPENDVMLRLVRRAFPGVRLVREDDVMRVIYPIGWASLTLTHEDLLADLLRT